MFAFIDFQGLADLMQRGGWVMWPLLALSILGLTLSFERVWFWLRTNNAVAVDRVRRMGELLRAGDKMAAKLMADKDRSVYGRIAAAMLAGKATEAAAAAAVDDQRPRMERFMSTLSTIITAAPMLGILGTVMGLIRAFDILSARGVTDPRTVSPAIAEALITTAAGLVIAIIVLFPYNAFRAQMDRTLSRVETLLAAMGVEKEENKT